MPCLPSDPDVTIARGKFNRSAAFTTAPKTGYISVVVLVRFTPGFRAAPACRATLDPFPGEYSALGKEGGASEYLPPPESIRSSSRLVLKLDPNDMLPHNESDALSATACFMNEASVPASALVLSIAPFVPSSCVSAALILPATSASSFSSRPGPPTDMTGADATTSAIAALPELSTSCDVENDGPESF